MKSLLKTTCSALAVCAMLSGPAEADPISAAIAATASAVSSAGGIAAIAEFTFMGLTGGGAVFASFAVRAALGFALNALTRPKSQDVDRSRSVNSLGPAQSHVVVYGRTRIGGAIFYQTTTDANEYLHRCIALAGHELDAIETIYLDGEAASIDGSGNVTSPSRYNGYVRINTHLGTDTQVADADLVSEVSEWTDAHQAKGVAYIYARFKNDGTEGAQAAFPNGSPPVVTALVRGRKVYDPRTDTTAWSTNPALCLRDYLTADFGLSEASSEINDDLVEEAANVCDEIAPSGGSRYTCNGSFLLNAAPEDIIRTIASSMGGLFWFMHGQWAMRAAKYNPPTLSFNEDDLRSSVEIATKHSRRDNFNVVRGVYVGAATDYQEADYEDVTDAAYLAEDNDIETAADLSFIFTDTESMARRLASIALERNRRQKTVSSSFGMRALNVKIGDTIKFNNTRAGWVDKTFECVDWRLGMTQDMDIQINMMLREIDAAVFA